MEIQVIKFVGLLFLSGYVGIRATSLSETIATTILLAIIVIL